MKSALISFLLLFMPFIVNASEMIAMQNGCLGCHQKSTKTVGPSIIEIRKKYTQSDIDNLAASLKKGRPSRESTGGSIHEFPSLASEADLNRIIQWMLTQ